MNVYIGTYTHDVFGENPTGSRGIYRCELNETTGALTILDAAECVNPSFVTLSPGGKHLLTAVEKKQGGALALFAIGPDGSLTPTAHQPLDGMECCFTEISPSGDFAVAAQYGSGEVFAYALALEGGFGPKIFSHFNKGSGPVADRQERAHVHSARLIPAMSMAVVCDLGCDTVSFFRYQESGEMVAHGIPALTVPAGTGPRHSEFTPDGRRLYLTGELSNEVLFYELADGSYQLRQRISTLPADFSGFNTAADIHRAAGGRTLLVSNRGHDSLAAFAVGEDGTLSAPRWTQTGKTPRQFALAGKFLLCACQDSGSVEVFPVDENGLPGQRIFALGIPGAVCIAPGR